MIEFRDKALNGWKSRCQLYRHCGLRWKHRGESGGMLTSVHDIGSDGEVL